VAKKKKMSRRENKPSFAFYKKILTGLFFAAVILGVYCYFFDQSSNIPVVDGPDYPKRTPGKSTARINYAVYDQLAAAQQSKSVALLPPEEVPSLPTWSDEQEAKPVPLESSPQPSSKNITQNPVVTSPSGPTAQTPVIKPFDTPTGKKSNLAPPSPVGKKGNSPAESKASIKQQPTKAAAAVPVAVQESKKQLEQPRKPLLRMQIGGLYKRSEQAHAIINQLYQKGGFPKGMRPVVQKANLKGQIIYRVILMGQCPPKTLEAYQNWLKKQRF